MIIATLNDCRRYQQLSPELAKGFEFLQNSSLSALDDGRIEIDGERVFAIVARGTGRGPAASPLEYHRRYIDIQYVVEGDEVVGWSPLGGCKLPSGPFDEASDIGFFLDAPHCWSVLRQGEFAIFFPEDAHAPLAGDGPIFKVVVKVAAS